MGSGHARNHERIAAALSRQLLQHRGKTGGCIVRHKVGGDLLQRRREFGGGRYARLMQRRTQHRKLQSANPPPCDQVCNGALEFLDQPDRVFVAAVAPIADEFKPTLNEVQAIGSERIVRAARGHMLDEAFERNENTFIPRNLI